MRTCNFVLLIIFLTFYSFSYTEEIATTLLDRTNFEDVKYRGAPKNDTEEIHENSVKKVYIQLYYECLCGFCIEFYTNSLKEVIIKLSPFLKIQTYPYGNAKTYKRGHRYIFKCQHGRAECYGNKLHACALHMVQNQTLALLYNSCMMDLNISNGDSDDIAAETCGTSMDVDYKPITDCAKGEMGASLLQYYGVETKKANIHGVPYVLVNGKQINRRNFMREVCLTFATPPAPCKDFVKHNGIQSFAM